jgi:uncharacterized delta-60 repeat protein
MLRPRLLLGACALAALTAPSLTLAQTPGDLDPSFGNGGYRVIDIQVNGGARGNSATGLALQADGKVVLGGTAGLISGSGEERMVAVRLTASGALDTGFDGDGIRLVDGLAGTTERYYDGRVAIGPDGGIYLFNGTSDSNGVAIGWVLAKLTSTGALDTGWNGNGKLAASANTLEAGDVAALASGQVLTFDDWWDTTQNPDNQQVAVGRRTATGAVDSGFGNAGYRDFGFDLGGTLGDFARVIYVQRDGKILVGGRAETGAGATPPADFFIARLTANGALDTSFGGGDGKVTVSFDLPFGNVDEVRALAVDARGRIYAGGIAGDFSTANDCALVRLLPDGTLDPAFGAGDGKVNFRYAGAAQGTFNQIFGLALQGDGGIVVVGRGTSSGYRRVGVARLTEAGDLDPTFGSNGSVLYSFGSAAARPSVGRAVALAEDGSIVLSGFTQITSGDNDFVAARLHNDYIFADGFESGDPSYWSSAAP